MDISGIKSSATRLDIIHPGTGKKTGFSVMLRPMDDRHLKRVIEASKTEGLKLAQRRKVPDAEEREHHATNTVIAAIESWSWDKDEDGNQSSFEGEQLELSPANVRLIISKFPDFATQIEDVYEEKKRFFQG